MTGKGLTQDSREVNAICCTGGPRLKHNSVPSLLLIVLAIAAQFSALAARSEVAEYTGPEGRTIKFRYELKAGWSPNEPRGVLIHFHGNSTGTQEDMISWVPNRAFAHVHNLVPVVVASPEAIPKGDYGYRWFSLNRSYHGHGTRFWSGADQRLVHQLLQSNFGQRFRVNFDRVFFSGTSQGACFLNDFMRSYAENYGGGMLLNCGCIGGSPPTPLSTWNPTDDFREKFRVFVRSTKQDFLYPHALVIYAYYRYTANLETAGDLQSEGGHCAAGDVTNESALEWLLKETSLPNEPAAPHLKRVSLMDEIVGITADRDGALWAARQAKADSHAQLWRSVDRGESFEAAARMPLDTHDIDAVGGTLMVAASENGAQVLYRSEDNGASFHRVALEGGGRHSNLTTDTDGNLYTVALNSEGQQEVYVSGDTGLSWSSLGGPPGGGYRGSFILSTPDPIQSSRQSSFLLLADDFGRGPSWLGPATGNDWNCVRTVSSNICAFEQSDPDGENISTVAWNGREFLGLLVDSQNLFTSTDRGASWSEERLPDHFAVSASTRITVIGNEELLVAGGGGLNEALLRGEDRQWHRIVGSWAMGLFPTVGDYVRDHEKPGFFANHSELHRVAIDRTHGDVYLTDGRGIFRLGAQFRTAGAASDAPDADSDGIPDAVDAFPNDSSEYLDTDGDGLGNRIDNDDDGDGVSDIRDAVPLDRFETIDTDADGVGNVADRDDDGDGVEDVIDAFPLDRSRSVDTDGDGIADSLDDDDDGDGVRDSEDAFPKYLHEWLDTDKDGIGDNLDMDDDNDGLVDVDDPRPKAGTPQPHLVPLARLPENLLYTSYLHFRAVNWLVKQASMHSERPSTHAYPKAAGESQEYGQITLGNGPIPDIQFMVDHLDGVSLLYVDRNNNGDLSDDGPPKRKTHDFFYGTFPWQFEGLFQIEVTYASGVKVPYILGSYRDLPEIRQGGGWIGDAALPGGSSVLVLTVDRDIDGLFTGADDYVCVDVNGDQTLQCDRGFDSSERFSHGDEAIIDGKTMRVLVAESGHRVDFELVRASHTLSLFPAAAHPVRQGFVRVINRADESAAVEINAFDDSGEAYGPVTLTVDAGATVHFNSDDLEHGNSDKGLSGGVGSGTGAWRLEMSTESDIEVLGYIRTVDGFVTSIHDRVPVDGERHEVPTFNPGSNYRQVSRLRLTNAGAVAATVTIKGIDDSGVLSPAARITVPSSESLELTARQLETGDAERLIGALGDGQGKWRLTVESDVPIQVMSLIESPTGHLTNISTRPSAIGDGVYRVPLFPSASQTSQQGFARVINHEARSGTVEITAFDDSGIAHGPASLSINGSQTVHFNSNDLELGNSSKGISTGIGEGTGTWRLELRSDLNIEVLGYIRTADGFVTSMHDLATLRDGRYYVPFLNPASNNRQVSRLRVTNSGTENASVSIQGTDDSGVVSSSVQVNVTAGASREYSAQQLEAGEAEGMVGSLGDGQGKWRLSVESDVPIHVMGVLESPTGHLTNLSTVSSAPDGR